LNWFSSVVSNPDIRKAAVLLLSLPKEAASQLMAKLTPQQVQLVSVEIARIGSLGDVEQEIAINDFAAACRSSIVEAKPFGFLQDVDNQNVLKLFIDEHPQTIALVLAHLRPAQAAEIIGGLPGDRRLDVVRRIAGMRQTSREILREVEQALRNRMSNAVSRQFEIAGGARSVAEILSYTDQATTQHLLEDLSHDDPGLVEEVNRLLDETFARRTAA